MINGYGNTGVQDRIKKDKIIIDIVKYILIIQIKEEKFLKIKNLEKKHYIIRSYGTLLRTEIPNKLI